MDPGDHTADYHPLTPRIAGPAPGGWPRQWQRAVSWPTGESAEPRSGRGRGWESVSVISGKSRREHPRWSLYWTISSSLLQRSKQNQDVRRFYLSWRKMWTSTDLFSHQHHPALKSVHWTSMNTNTARTPMMTSGSMTSMILRTRSVASPQPRVGVLTAVRPVQRLSMRIWGPGWDRGRSRCLKTLSSPTLYRWTDYILKICMKWFLPRDPE